MTAPADFLSAFRRCDQAAAAQLAPAHPLGCGLAYCAPAWPLLPQANQVRDVLLLDCSAEQAYDAVESHFAGLQGRCLRWALSSEQSADPIDALLQPRGWVQRRRTVLGLEHWPSLDEMHSAPGATLPDFRILPARAMRKAYRRSFLAWPPDAAESTPNIETQLVAQLASQRADAALERLNDSELDAFVAVRGDQPVGRIGLLCVGDICRIEDPYLVPPHAADDRLANALLRQVLTLAYRLRPRAVVAEADFAEAVVAEAVVADEAADSAGSTWRTLLQQSGFRQAGSLPEWTRRPA